MLRNWPESPQSQSSGSKLWKHVVSSYSETGFIFVPKFLLVLVLPSFLFWNRDSVDPKMALNSPILQPPPPPCLRLCHHACSSLLCSEKTLRILWAPEATKAGYAMYECLEIEARNPAASPDRQSHTYSPEISTYTYELFNHAIWICCSSHWQNIW